MKTKVSRYKLALLACFVMIPLAFFGQNADRKFIYVTGDVGGAMLFGDNKFELKDTRMDGHLGVGYQFGGVLGLEGKIGYGALYGKNEGRDFKTDNLNYLETNLNLTANMMNLIGSFREDRLFSIIPHVGIGQIEYRLKSMNYDGTELLGTIGYDNHDENNIKGRGIDGRKVVMTLPMGVTFDFHVAPKWDVFLDVTANWVDTKRLENLDAGDHYDWFANANVGVKYRIFKRDNIKKMAANFEMLNITTTPEILEEQGNMVNVTIEGEIPPRYFNKNAVMNLTPILSYENGETVLPPINLKGENVAGNAIAVSHKDGGMFTYTTSIPYTKEMQQSVLTIEPIIYEDKGVIHPDHNVIKAKEKYVLGDIYALADGIITTSHNIDRNALQTAWAPNNYQPNELVSEQGDIYYYVNNAQVNWKMPLNEEAQNQTDLQNLTEYVQQGWPVNNIDIEGWASPEGPYKLNENLSNHRAESAANYVKSQLKQFMKDKNVELSFNNLNEIDFIVKGYGPDWDGFYTAMQNSNIKDKNAIITKIKNADQSQREQEMRDLIAVYPEMENTILPMLRRSIINVNTNRPSYTEEEIVIVAMENPSNLSCNELLWAATLVEEQNQQQEILNNAVTLYPECPNAYVNAAVIEINNANYDQATSMLNTALAMDNQLGEAYNNLGIIDMMQGDYLNAENNFNMAQSLGVNESYNLGVVEITKGNFSKAISMIESTGATCDYNLALAQALNKKYTLATETLSCTNETGQTLYLQSVIAVRTKDVEKALAHLESAIIKDPSFREMAKIDPEFLPISNNPEFIALVY